MAEIKVEREPRYGVERPRSVWPVWLAGALGVAGLLAVLTMSDRPTPQAANDGATTTTVAYQGQTLSNRGMEAVQFPDRDMVRVATSREGVELYRHRAQATGGGGGGRPSTQEPIYMKTGLNTYLPLKPVR